MNENKALTRLSTSFIEKIKAVPVSDIIGHYIKLTRKGINFSACCPFHDEKSPSFSVNDIKEIYKCFGCGVSGDGLQFVIEHEKKNFFDACIAIADIAGIEIEKEQIEFSQEQKDILSAAEAQEEVLNFVIPKYRQKLIDLANDHPAKVWLQKRGISIEIINEWNLGWAGEDWHFITPQLINKGCFEAANKIGVIRRTHDNESNYDGYRSRIIFPITDKNGRFVGIGGRYISIDNKDASKIPKYINPPDCELYNKSTVLFGLSQAARHIKEIGYAIIVEGYMDTLSPHKAGFKNVVCTCGTAFALLQMQLLKKYTNRVVMMRDNDKAGIISFNHSLPLLLKQGFKVELMVYDSHDPDDWIQSLDSYNNTGGWKFPEIKDAVMHRVLDLWNAAEDLHAKAEAKNYILDLLTNIDNEILRGNYLDEISKTFKWKNTETKKQFSVLMEKVSPLVETENEKSLLPEWVNAEQKNSFEETGYIAVDRKTNGKAMVGYYSFTAGGKTQITNFLITPLFHVYAGVESRFLVEIYNGKRRGVLDVPAKVITSVEQFQAFAVSEGNFLIHGAKAQWLRIASDILEKFQRCIELNSLGWQNFNFFAWVNKIYIPGEGLKDLNNWGIIKHDNENFLVPASCEAYRQLQRTGDDPYENDRYLTYKESPVDFSTWSKQLNVVYLQKGIVGIAYVILTLFRDIVFDIDNNCPHLYAFGEPSSGKSKFAESLAAIFYFKRSAFNLNSGTDFAFFNYMQRYCNAPAHLNEFDIDVIKPEWFQAIKGIYDGEGRERGKGGSKNRTEVMRVRSNLMLTGHKLVTADDNSVVTRSLIEGFSVEEYNDQRKKDYDILKDWEKKGMSSMLVELLCHRKFFQEKYKDYYNDQLSEWRKNKTDNVQLNQRIMQNYAHLATGYKMISQHIALPQSAEEFTAYCYKQAIKWSHFIRSSDTLSEFWRTLEFLIDQQLIHENWDYKIDEVLSLKIRVSRDKEADHNFEKPTKVLYIRLNNIHKLFQSTYRTRTGKEAMNMENLLHYFSSRKYYLGSVKSKIFKRYITVTENRQSNGAVNGNYIETSKQEQQQKSSCYAFIYDELGIEIERSHEKQADLQDGYIPIKNSLEKNTDQLPFGKS